MSIALTMGIDLQTQIRRGHIPVFTQQFIDALNKADRVYLTEIECNRERQEDYPGVSSHLITDGIEGAQIVDENDLSNLTVEKGGVLLIVSCASVSHLVENIKKKYI